MKATNNKIIISSPLMNVSPKLPEDIMKKEENKEQSQLQTLTNVVNPSNFELVKPRMSSIDTGSLMDINTDNIIPIHGILQLNKDGRTNKR